MRFIVVQGDGTNYEVACKEGPESIDIKLRCPKTQKKTDKNKAFHSGYHIKLYHIRSSLQIIIKDHIIQPFLRLVVNKNNACKKYAQASDVLSNHLLGSL